MNIYSKSNQNLIHYHDYLSCHAVRCNAYLNFCSGCMFKGIGLKFWL